MLKKTQRKGLATLAIATLVWLVAAPFSANAFLLTGKDDTFRATGALRASATEGPNSDEIDAEQAASESAMIFITRFENAASALEPTLTLHNQTNADNTKHIGLRQFTFKSEPDTPVPVPWNASPDSGGIVPAPENAQATANASPIVPASEYEVSSVTLRLAGSIINSNEFSPVATKYQSEKGSHALADGGTDCIGGTPNCSGTPSGEVPVPVPLALFGLGALLGHRKLLQLS